MITPSPPRLGPTAGKPTRRGGEGKGSGDAGKPRQLRRKIPCPAHLWDTISSQKQRRKKKIYYRSCFPKEGITVNASRAAEQSVESVYTFGQE